MSLSISGIFPITVAAELPNAPGLDPAPSEIINPSPLLPTPGTAESLATMAARVAPGDQSGAAVSKSLASSPLTTGLIFFVFMVKNLSILSESMTTGKPFSG